MVLQKTAAQEKPRQTDALVVEQVKDQMVWMMLREHEALQNSLNDEAAKYKILEVRATLL